MKRFPVLKRGTRDAMPRSVPWEFVETFRSQAEYNHGQTLERLAERGGLCPEEMWVAANGKNLRYMFDITEELAIAWLESILDEIHQDN